MQKSTLIIYLGYTDSISGIENHKFSFFWCHESFIYAYKSNFNSFFWGPTINTLQFMMYYYNYADIQFDQLKMNRNET